MKRIKILSLVCAYGLLAGVPAAKAQVNVDSLEAVYDSLELSGVTVTAAKPMVKMEADKMTYDVASDADSQSSTVLDMLRKVPMVTVDGQDNITVNGSSAFKVYVDGKPNPMFSQNASQVFKMMPAAAVEKIEVITNPGAKYDAEGAVGILNIVLARQQGGAASKALDGVTGTIRVAGGNKGGGGGAFISAHQGKLSASANVIGQYQNLKDLTIDLNRTSTGATSQEMRQHQKSHQRTPFTMGTVNLSYDLDSLNTLSGSVGLTAFRAKMEGRNETYTSLLTTGYDQDYKMGSTALNVSADWQHFFSASRDRSLTLSYLLSYAPQKTEFTLSNFITSVNGEEVNVPTGTSLQPMSQSNKARSMEHTLQLDYTMPLSATQTLSLGSKAILRRNTSDVEDYHHKNNIAAAYAEHAASFGKFSTKAGLRYEHTWQKAAVSTNYGTLIPSASLSYSPKMTQNIGLTYNMRISRPGITYLNPYVDRSNPEAISYGDPDIDVSKTHNVGLSFSSFTQKLMVNASIHQTFTNDQIAEYSFYDGNILHTTYGNIGKERSTSLTAFVNWLIATKTRLMLNGGLSYVDLRTRDDAFSLLASSPLIDSNISLVPNGNERGLRNHGWQGNIMLGLQQTLPWNLQLSANAIMNSRTYTLQGHSTGFKLGVLSLTKSFFSDRLSITLSGVTALGNGGKLALDTSTRGYDFEQTTKVRVPMQQVQLTLSYTFGNTGVKAKEHKSRIENDFMEKKSDSEQLSNSTGM